MTVVLDSVSAAQTDIYVDLNRNRVIEGNERLTSPGPKYPVPLSVEIPTGSKVERFPAQWCFVGQVGAGNQLRHGGLCRGHPAT